jgi:hypothetical protein
MSEPYTLKTRVGINTLSHLNDHQKNRMGRLKGALECFSTNDAEEIIDLVHAVFSGKKIVNPMSPREELEMYLTDRQEEAKYPSGDDVRIRVIGIKQGVKKAIEIIAKEHPDVADWLKDSDKDE